VIFPTKICQNVKSSGIAIYRVVVGRFVRNDAVQYSKYTANEHGHRTVYRIVHAVNAAVFLVADDTDNCTLYTYWTPPPAFRQTETHHHSKINTRREKNVVTRVQGQLVAESP
jgi:hypothetical protein